MTPTEEAAKLAERIATDIAWDYIDLGDDPEYRADQFRLRLIEELTAAFAERDEELKRLSEAAERAERWCSYHLKAVKPVGLYCEDGMTDVRDALRAALQPKEPNNES